MHRFLKSGVFIFIIMVIDKYISIDRLDRGFDAAVKQGLSEILPFLAPSLRDILEDCPYCC